ncbi:hypothetical protein Ais01nite_66010 [Asanoa ishikariensis]|uniref:SMI1/KNR4 family protein n=1 Tax=Asanoa ishikariensis TaxID=137265 RepID=A0A1H3NK39_9ACTN|nr:hypothetical protein [Asanoa ishikariensis]GIF68566.1 hypothetical protein Ais01nite_66010 [Asanoa ishikariensis]SDY89178.1 hypothetical protein SAMN05421684_2123 [Asanoa ishikariensis]
MLDAMIDRLMAVGVAHVGPSVDAPDLARAALPDEYAALLTRLNGFTVNAGAVRLFGLRPERHLDLRAWNAPDGWRFAWDERVEPFLCIGQTAFGEQYALRRGPDGYAPEIYLLEPNFLRPEVIAASFAEFVALELVGNAEDPYDPVLVEAIARLGPIDPENNWVYTPSLALGGPEDLTNLMPMSAYLAMVIGGDIALGVEPAPDGAVITKIVPWFDELERPRIRVEFG